MTWEDGPNLLKINQTNSRIIYSLQTMKSPGAVEMSLPIRIFQAVDTDSLAGRGGVDETVVSQVHTHMGAAFAQLVEKYQISGAQVLHRDTA